MPNFTFMQGVNTQDNDFVILFQNLDTDLKNSSPENSPLFNNLNDLEWEPWILKQDEFTF